jgi:Predicted hydrolases or acyltransferases (alpha/beta hydrolase superfamily)
MLRVVTIILSVIWILLASVCLTAQSVVGPSKHYSSAGDLRFRYTEWNRSGDNAVVLLHGLYDTSETWAATATLLAQRGFRVIALDRRGAGGSSKPQTGYGIETLSNDVIGLAERLGLRGVTIVGHSAGASVALTAGSVRPDIFRSVVLVDGGFWPKSDDQTTSQNTPKECDKNGKRCDRAIAIEKGNREYDAEAIYPKVSIPVLLIMATPDLAEDQPSPPFLDEAKKHVETVAKDKLKHGRAAFISGSGHWIQTDQPQKLAEAIIQFTAQQQTPDRPHHPPE